MNKLKDFFIRMCEVENVSVEELMDLTGKSKSVVYDWLDYSKENVLPGNEDLSKILCRLGITLDEYLQCKSDKLPKEDKYRIYKNYITGEYVNKCIASSVLENPNYECILNCFIDDVIDVKSMLDDYLNGNTIDLERFDMLCAYLSPTYWSDAAYLDEGDGIIGSLDSSSLEDYKERNERVKMSKEEDLDEEDRFHLDLYFPNLDYLALTVADKKSMDIFKRYVFILDECGLKELEKHYHIMLEHEPEFDKSKKILKYIEKSINK